MSIPIMKSIQDILYNENDCINFLFDKGIINKFKKCLQCGSSLYVERKLFRCSNTRCRKSFSVLKNSCFENNHISCSDMMLLGYYWLCKANYTTISNITGHSPNTIVKYINFFRNLVICSLKNKDEKVGGNNVIVEIDESKFIQQKNSNDGTWIVGGIERTEKKKIFLKVVKNRNARTLKAIIKKYVKPGSIVMTDMWKGYQGLEILGLIHKKINHGKNFVDPITGAHTNTIEGTWGGLKLQIRPRNRDKDKINNHLLEIIWRRKHRGDLWNAFLDVLRIKKKKCTNK